MFKVLMVIEYIYYISCLHSNMEESFQARNSSYNHKESKTISHIDGDPKEQPQPS